MCEMTTNLSLESWCTPDMRNKSIYASLLVLEYSLDDGLNEEGKENEPKPRKHADGRRRGSQHCDNCMVALTSPVY